MTFSTSSLSSHSFVLRKVETYAIQNADNMKPRSTLFYMVHFEETPTPFSHAFLMPVPYFQADLKSSMGPSVSDRNIRSTTCGTRVHKTRWSTCSGMRYRSEKSKLAVERSAIIQRKSRAKRAWQTSRAIAGWRGRSLAGSEDALGQTQVKQLNIGSDQVENVGNISFFCVAKRNLESCPRRDKLAAYHFKYGSNSGVSSNYLDFIWPKSVGKFHCTSPRGVTILVVYNNGCETIAANIRTPRWPTLHSSRKTSQR